MNIVSAVCFLLNCSWRQFTLTKTKVNSVGKNVTREFTTAIKQQPTLKTSLDFFELFSSPEAVRGWFCCCSDLRWAKRGKFYKELLKLLISLHSQPVPAAKDLLAQSLMWLWNAEFKQCVRRAERRPLIASDFKPESSAILTGKTDQCMIPMNK